MNMQSRAYVCGRKPMAIKYHTTNLLFFKGSIAVIRASFILREHEQKQLRLNARYSAALSPFC